CARPWSHNAHHAPLESWPASHQHLASTTSTPRQHHMKSPTARASKKIAATVHIPAARRLPIELIDCIMRQFASARDLLPVLRVSKAWYRTGMTRLYRSVAFSGHRQRERFFAALSADSRLSPTSLLPALPSSASASNPDDDTQGNVSAASVVAEPPSAVVPTKSAASPVSTAPPSAPRMRRKLSTVKRFHRGMLVHTVHFGLGPRHRVLVQRDAPNATPSNAVPPSLAASPGLAASPMAISSISDAPPPATAHESAPASPALHLEEQSPVQLTLGSSRGMLNLYDPSAFQVSSPTSPSPTSTLSAQAPGDASAGSPSPPIRDAVVSRVGVHPKSPATLAYDARMSLDSPIRFNPRHAVTDRPLAVDTRPSGSGTQLESPAPMSVVAASSPSSPSKDMAISPIRPSSDPSTDQGPSTVPRQQPSSSLTVTATAEPGFASPAVSAATPSYGEAWEHRFVSKFLQPLAAFCPNIRNLSLSGCHMYDYAFDEMLRSLPNLERLDISYTTLKRAGLEAVATHCRHRLMWLNVSGIFRLGRNKTSSLIDIAMHCRLLCTMVSDETVVECLEISGGRLSVVREASASH
ncbi:hypothetical protein BC831DRAFT_472258, partial [Entophlyctis helioformis]